MSVLSQNLSRPRRRMAIAIAGAGLAAALIGTSFIAAAQDQSAATPKDVIFARKTLMGAISDNMDQIEMMIAVNKIDLNDGHEHADTMSIMFMAFPHLFPPSSNQWKPNNADIDPATDTFASPDVWSKFPDFYQRAAAASKIAFNISRADKVDEFKAATAQLRVACNACHAAYLKTQ
ncbi:MAG TPA: cytochrome c [Xanthobacteraceae bacterium]